jgi:hypothetical protein
MEFVISSEWSSSHIQTIISEIKNSNGKIKNVLKYDNVIKIMSKFSTCMRYDIVSPTDNVTYRVPFAIGTDLDTFIV